MNPILVKFGCMFRRPEKSLCFEWQLLSTLTYTSFLQTKLIVMFFTNINYSRSNISFTNIINGNSQAIGREGRKKIDKLVKKKKRNVIYIYRLLIFFFSTTVIIQATWVTLSNTRKISGSRTWSHCLRRKCLFYLVFMKESLQYWKWKIVLGL